MLGKEFVRKSAAEVKKMREQKQQKQQELKVHFPLDNDLPNLLSPFGQVQGGERFKSKKGAGGDVKKLGAIDPYAYMPLDAAQLNKRARHSASKRYESILNKGGKAKVHGGVSKKRGQVRAAKMGQKPARQTFRVKK